ncbi:hypothetical protein C8J56DRAFT_900898 [Mycena floridula]|nr:hypothetical protein C8J56DRAFT_900898 [Mycena floridula]
MLSAPLLLSFFISLASVSSKLLSLTMPNTIELGKAAMMSWTADGSGNDQQYTIALKDNAGNPAPFAGDPLVNPQVTIPGSLQQDPDELRTFHLDAEEMGLPLGGPSKKPPIGAPSKSGALSSSPVLESSHAANSKSSTASATEPLLTTGNRADGSTFTVTVSVNSHSTDEPVFNSPTSASHHLNVGGIIGGVVVLIVIVIVSILVLFLKRRKKRSSIDDIKPNYSSKSSQKATILDVPQVLEALPQISRASASIPVTEHSSAAQLMEENQMLRAALDRAVAGRRESWTSSSTGPPPYHPSSRRGSA